VKGKTMELKYLFFASLQDGAEIEQTHADVSRTDPNRNAFYDVLLRIYDVRVFGLQDSDGQQVVFVDLETGAFEINGCEFYVGEILPLGTKYRLMYFQRVHAFNPPVCVMLLSITSVGKPRHLRGGSFDRQSASCDL
jgi:hypothetical protein